MARALACREMVGLVENERALLADGLIAFGRLDEQWLRDHLQCVFQGALLECSTLAEPGTVQAVVLAAGLFLVINKLCYCTKQTPSGIFCSQQFSTTPWPSNKV